MFLGVIVYLDTVTCLKSAYRAIPEGDTEGDHRMLFFVILGIPFR